MDTFIYVFVFIFWFVFSLCLYFIPSFIATLTKKKNALAIFFLNLLLGWTGIGWIGAFIWSVVKD
jgi:hypothetical protein